MKERATATIRKAADGIGRASRIATVATLTFALGAPVLAQTGDRMTLGPRQFEHDTTGHGAVLCTWSIYLALRTKAKTCGWPPAPIDSVIDEAIAAIDAFILAHSSLRPTREALEAFKRHADEEEAAELRQEGLERACNRPDLRGMRNVAPDQVRESVRRLLAVPREPVMNPCL